MDAHEREPEPTTAAEPGRVTGPGVDGATAHERCPERGPVSMHELLASCAAADAVSTPPASARNPEDDDPEGPDTEAA
ncbi:MAG TPA: hypothetical protein VFY14_03700 [Streptomyces sp.]|nr:hypothetical protein [Streptomyces sp.]